MKKILISTGILILVIVLAFYLKSVLGSGGSFTKTEHGGTDVNTNSITGVYRSSVDKTATGHPAAAGECVHCHEEHASIEGTEPAPTGGPDDYLLMRANDNNLCYECHTGSLNRIWPGSGALNYDGSGHGSTTALYNSRDVKLCVQCHNPHGAIDTDYSATNPCPRMTRYIEEKTCLSNGGSAGAGCHGSAGNPTGAKNIYSLFYTKTYRHPLSPALDAARGKTGVHSSLESQSTYPTGTAFYGANRHVECVDCHNPHTARNYGTAGNSTHTATGATYPAPTNIASRALLGAWGVEPTYGATPWIAPTSYTVRNFTTVDDTANKEYQLCFKCHSSFAYGATPPSGYTDQSIEFNPNNKSYHPVRSLIPTNSYTSPSATNGNRETMAAPWNNGAHDLMYCSDCHGSETDTDPEGPHGSTNQYIIIRSTSATDNTLCLRCHLSTVYNPASNPGSGTETGSRFDQQTSGNNSANHYNHVTSRGKFCRDCHAGTQTLPTGNSPVALAPGSAHGTNTVTGFVNGVNMNSYTIGNCDPACHGNQTYTAGVE